MRLYLITFVLILLASSACGQAVLYDRGTSGTNLGIAYSGADYHNSTVFYNLYGLSLSNTVGGNVDLGAVISTLSEANAFSISFEAAYLPIKQDNESIPFSLGLRAGVQTVFGSGVIGTSSVLGGLTFYRKADLSRRAGVVFYVGGSVASTTDWEDSMTVLEVGCPIYDKIGKKTLLYLAPGLAVNEEVTAVSLTIGVSFIK